MRLRRLALLGVVIGALAAAAPAGAINDPRVPGDECSPDNSAAVGDPTGGNPGINGPSPVNPPASLFGPGEPPGAATGALGAINGGPHAFLHCTKP
jgi:hypothetical protein